MSEDARRHVEARGDPDAYASVIAKLDAHAGSREGHPAVMHVAALGPDGDIRIVDLWGSAEQFAEFPGDAIGAAAGDELPPLEPRVVPVYNGLRRASTAAG
jgi:hypothetical protein